MFTTITLSSAAVEVLGQLFVSGPTWDGNIASKAGRGELFQAGLVDRYEGFTFLTRDGLVAAVDWNARDHADKRWYKKQNGV